METYAQIKHRQINSIIHSDFLSSKEKLKLYKKMRIEANKLLQSLQVQYEILSQYASKE